MKIELREISIRDVSNGYINDDEDGVVGYDGKLNIRPKYQREYVYKDEQRNAVINTVMKNFPLNVIYWVKNADNTYEVLDGQQRIISICEYVCGTKNRFSMKVGGRISFFNSLTDTEKNQILDYKLMVYFCEGSDKEKLDWFKTINIAGVKLTDQELRNAIFTGTWLSDAKKSFSKTGCRAYNIANKYMEGSPIRQEYLETVIDWISGANGNKDKIEEYMSKHQNDKDAEELWQYFSSVIDWVKRIFTEYRKEMKGIAFGPLYDKFKNERFNSIELDNEILNLLKDEDVTDKKGIYTFVLTRNEKHLSVRKFSDNQKRESYEKQCKCCKKCNSKFEIDDMEGDHITPWSKGGKTISENCQMLCKNCNRTKTDA